MKLRGQHGYAMAALLVGLGIMAIMMTVVMPVWKQVAQREKEAELIFRGEQYARAIELYGRKLPGALPPNLDVLIDQRFLRLDIAAGLELAAGCDVVLHCNGERREMEAVAAASTPLSAAARRRVSRAEAMRGAPQPVDRAAVEARLDALLGKPAA